MSSSPNDPSSLTRWTNRILIVLFTLVLALPSLDAVLRLDPSRQPTENRALAPMPKYPSGLHGLQDCVRGLDTYFNDHFGFRKTLVKWHNKLRWSLFKDKQDSHVVAGQGGWLFYMYGDMFDEYSGRLQFTPAQLRDWQVLLEKRRDWLARRGIPYLFVVTPSKQSIYSEFLPEWLIKSKVTDQTKLDQFVAYMHAHSTVSILDLRRVVSRGRLFNPTYLMTDSHWNLYGGFLGYQELVRALASQRPDLREPLPLSSFTLTNYLRPGGDLAKLLGLSLIESNACALLPKPGLPAFTTRMSPPDHPKDPKSTVNPQAGGRLLVFQDSFAINWIPFLAYHFQRVDYLWQYELDPAWINREKPGVVVSEMNEPFFDSENPKKLIEQDALN